MYHPQINNHGPQLINPIKAYPKRQQVSYQNPSAKLNPYRHGGLQGNSILMEGGRNSQTLQQPDSSLERNNHELQLKGQHS